MTRFDAPSESGYGSDQTQSRSNFSTVSASVAVVDWVPPDSRSESFAGAHLSLQEGVFDHDPDVGFATHLEGLDNEVELSIPGVGSPVICGSPSLRTLSLTAAPSGSSTQSSSGSDGSESESESETESESESDSTRESLSESESESDGSGLRGSRCEQSGNESGDEVHTRSDLCHLPIVSLRHNTCCKAVSLYAELFPKCRTSSLYCGSTSCSCFL